MTRMTDDPHWITQSMWTAPHVTDKLIVWTTVVIWLYVVWLLWSGA